MAKKTQITVDTPDFSSPEDNRWWERSASNPTFDSPEELWACACEYFKWSQDNPLYDIRPFQFKGDVVFKAVPKKRAFSLPGLCNFLKITMGKWQYMKNKKAEFTDVICKIEQVIFQQKFENAAANILDAVMLSKDLGLKESHALSGSVNTSTKIDLCNLSNSEVRKLVNIIEKAKKSDV
ncbi:MAG TPA: terminase small subunit [Fervidobacterium sp.]|nr:terminase small subunit [Fervidobacterium sp.]